MPVRKRRQIEAREVRMVEHRRGTWSARREAPVQRSASTAAQNVGRGSNAGPGKTIVAPRRQADEHAEHHAEAMIKRDGNAEAIVWTPGACPAAAPSAIVQEVAMAERRALGAPVVPLVNWMLIAWSGSSAGAGSSPSSIKRELERDTRRGGRAADFDHVAQARAGRDRTAGASASPAVAGISSASIPT